MRIGLVGRKGGQLDSVHDNLSELLISFAEAIQNRGHTVVFELETFNNVMTTKNSTFVAENKQTSIFGTFENITISSDICIVMGGDGTMLNAAKLLTSYNVSSIPILGINLGRVGFITDVPHDFDPNSIIEMLEKGNYKSEKRSLLRISNNGIGNTLALNDIVISRSSGKILEFNVSIDGLIAYKARGDGLIIATPTGSTAYAMSAGGSIIHPTASVIEVIPIMPQTLSCRPIILNDTSYVDFELVNGEAQIFADGNLIRNINSSEHLEIFKADRKVEFIHPNISNLTYNYFNTLSEKLNWHKSPGK